MTPEEVHKKLQEQFGDVIVEFNGEALDPWIKIKPENTFEIAQFLRDNKDLAFDCLMCLSGMDYGAGSDVGVVYSLYSMKHKHRITLRVDLPRENPEVTSVETIWRTADWHEREAFDLFGIHFEGHRDLRRILCPDDWEGYPLRKDYVVQEFYHGIRVPYQEDWGKYEALQRNPERGHFVFKFESKVPDLLALNENGNKKAGKEKE